VFLSFPLSLFVSSIAEEVSRYDEGRVPNAPGDFVPVAVGTGVPIDWDRDGGQSKVPGVFASFTDQQMLPLLLM
jgi:hypothetical protein